MIRHVTLVESQTTLVRLTDEQASSLQAAGQRLASSRTWWGAVEASTDRTVIRCEPQLGGLWSVRVIDAIGLVAIGDLHLEVRPKVPLGHVLYLLFESGYFPRMDEGQLQAALGQTFWELIARWYVTETERLLRKDLLSDYQQEEGWLPTVRGRLDPARTTRALAVGRLNALCAYEDYVTDTPLNRTLREAAKLVAASPTLPWPDRRRALAIEARMTDVGRFQRADAEVPIDRRSLCYRSAVALARHIIAGQGRSVESGLHQAQTFLIRTPEMIEEGIRRLLRRRIGERWNVVKQGRQLGGSSMTFNPDLVFGDRVAIGDVKYKRLEDGWSRADLYQLIAFSVAFETRAAALIGFRRTVPEAAIRAQVGQITVQQLVWQADSNVSPATAADYLVTQTEQWLRHLSFE